MENENPESTAYRVQIAEKLGGYHERLKSLEESRKWQIYLLFLIFVALASLAWDRFTNLVFPS